MLPRTDSQLAAAALDGDGAAFAELYDRHERRAFNLAYRITGTRENAADATQEAFVRLLARLPAMTGRELDFGAYLLTTVRHCSYDVIRQARRAEPTGEIADSARPVGAAGAPPPEEDPGRRVLLAAQQEEIRAANARLPPRQRAALALRELEDLSYDDIAAQMGMNRNSVAQLISRARIGLRDALRRTALASVAPATAQCERALALVAMRDDGEITEDRWLDEHLTDCETCALAREAMAEAGASYRAWASIAVLEALRRDTIAKAADRLGHDWSGVAARSEVPASHPLRSRAAVVAAAAPRPPRRRLRRDALVAVAGAFVLLLVVLAARAQDGALEAGTEPAEVTGAPTATLPAAPAPAKARTGAAKPATRAAGNAAAARVPPVESAPAPAPAAERASDASRATVPAPRRQTPPAGPSPAAPVQDGGEIVPPAAPGDPAVRQPDVAPRPPAPAPPPPPPAPPPPPPPRPVVTTFVAPPPPPPTRPPRIVAPSGGSSGVPAP
ncbi:MAG: RNA polymerase sigma factor [Thermoleophilia bacterium]